MTLLSVRHLTAHYGDFQALFGLTLEVAEGEAVAIIGANGAGKSTLLRTVVGHLRAAADAVAFDGRPIGGLPAHAMARLGLALVPEGRRLFASLSVEENLRIGNYAGRAGPWDLARVYRLFPVLSERRHASATALSGGQQQMVAIGRALMANPRLLLCDELSLGLAPVVIREIYESLPAIIAGGTTLVIVEQDINQALAVADQVYCLQEGRLSLSGRPRDLTREQIAQAYFGV
jgi:branched-chain amino acid transport system ATP-binding protein